MTRTILCLGLATLLAGAGYARTVHTFQGRDYTRAVPSREPDGGYRLLVFLHGQGGNEHQAMTLAGEYGPERGYIVLGPKSFENTWVSRGKDPKFVYGLIEEYQERYDIPRHRTLVVGYSAGGSVGLFMFLKAPHMASAFCMVNGFTVPQFVRQLVRKEKVRILALTGQHDKNLKGVEAAMRILRRHGYYVNAGRIKGGGHEYDRRKLNPIIIDWFEKQIAFDEKALEEAVTGSPEDPSSR